MVSSNARLITQEYNQVEGVNFDETFGSIARLEHIRILLSITCYMKFKPYQMNVKYAFFGIILFVVPKTSCKGDAVRYFCRGQLKIHGGQSSTRSGK